MKNKRTLQQDKDIFVTKPTFLRRTFSFRNFLIIIVLVFTTLTYLAKEHNYFKTDLTITLFIQNYNPVWFDLLMRFVSFVGDVSSMTILISLLVIYGFKIGKRHAPLMLIVSVVGGLVLSYILKLVVARPRPDPNLIYQIGNFFWWDSFPSGHVLGAVSLYGFLLYIAYTQLKKNLFRKLIIGICILMMTLMGLSRIYLGAHWFSDVLGAYLLGFIWLTCVVFVYQKLNPKVKPE